MKYKTLLGTPTNNPPSKERQYNIDAHKNASSKSKAIHAKMGEKKGMEPGEYRYKAASMPKHNASHEERVEHYAKNKGSYVKNVLGKDKKYI